MLDLSWLIRCLDNGQAIEHGIVSQQLDREVSQRYSSADATNGMAYGSGSFFSF